MSSVERLIDDATSAMYPGRDTSVDTLRNKVSEIANGQFDSLGNVWQLKADLRKEFRGIYESIIDSTIASMY